MRHAVLVALLALALAGAACTGDDDASTTTSSVVDTTATPATTSTTTTTTLPSMTTTPTIPATSTTLPPLVKWHSGGYAFQVGTADDTAALIVALANYRDFFHDRIPEVSVLPDPRWRARVIIGHDLRFQGPGGDPTEPPEVVEEEWPVVAGTITILEMASISADCGPGGMARALFEDFEALTPDGTRVRLGDFEAWNEHWGCVGA